MAWKLIIIFFVVFAGFVWINFEPLANISPVLYQSSILLPGNSKPVNGYKPSLPSLEQIFSNNHRWEATLSAKKIRTLLVTGDVIPARSVNTRTVFYKDFKWPFMKVFDLLNNADIAFINLETPLIKQCIPTNEGMVFCGDSKHIEGLNFAGVDIVTLANNHAGNYGEQGIKETVYLLSQNNIMVTGINNNVVKDIKGTRFAFLGFNDVTSPQPGISNVEEDKIKLQIMEAKKQADVVVVAFHWGIEYQSQPDQRQRILGRLAIDSGADLVIGNHPHWIQPVEIYKNKLITYAHGNFIFDQMWSQKTREGVVGRYTFYENQLIDVEYLPIQIQDYGQPALLEGVQKKAILDNMKDESEQLIKL